MTAPGLDDPRVTTFGLLVEAHARLQRLLGASLEERCDLPLVWFEVLLRVARSRGQRLAMGRLAEQIALTSGGVTRLVDRLQDAGLVRRQACPTDRRVTYVALTPAGRTRLEEALKVHAADVDRHLTSRLSPEELAALTKILDRLRAA